MRSTSSFVLGILVALAVATSSPPAEAQGKKGKAKEPAAESSERPAGANACGCYAEPDGTCKCSKKSKCGCPGECEPAGCEERRQKDFEKEQQDEIRKQQDAQSKRDAELKKRQEEQELKEEEQKGARGKRK
jgi:hypothetical protein